MVGLFDEPLYPPYLCQFSPRTTLASCGRRIYSANDADRLVPPDTRFRYGGAQWQLAGAVAEVVSGKSWHQLVRETYVEPCLTRHFGYTNQFAGGTRGYPSSFHGRPSDVLATDNPNIEGGAYATAEDYGKLLLMFLRGGTCGETRVLSDSAVARMEADRIGTVYGGSTSVPALQGYGMGWWIDRNHPGVIADPGFYGAVPWIDRNRGYGAFIAIEGNSTQGTALWARTKPILDSIVDAARR